MGILTKYILKNIWEKKLRTLLIILSITISAALYFASSSISDTIVSTQMEKWRSSTGFTDILVNAWWESPSRYFSKSRVEDLKGDFEYATGSVSGYGTFSLGGGEKLGVSLQGIDYDELQNITPVKIDAGSFIKPFGGMKIIISLRTSQKYGLMCGDSMTLNILGARHKFLVCGVAQPSGPFTAEGENALGIVPVDTLSSIYGVRGKVDTLYIKLKPSVNKEEAIHEVAGRYPRYHVSEPFTEKEIRSQSNKTRIPFLVLTIILSFMSIYIINSTFRVITLERLPVIGTFRSVGATRMKMNVILIIESLFYGAAGGALGSALGVLILYIMSKLTISSISEGYRVSICFSPLQPLYTIALAAFLSVLSSIVPILRVSRIPVKDIVLNTDGLKRSRTAVKSVLGMVLLAAGASLPFIVEGPLEIAVKTLGIVLVIAAFVMLIPLISSLFIFAASKPYSILFGNEATIALKNIRDNRCMYGSMSLLAIGISCLLLVTTLSFSTFRQQLDYFERQTFDIYMSAKNVTPGYLEAIRRADGVRDVYKAMGIGGIEVVEKRDTIGLTQGIDVKRFLEFNNIDMKGDRQEILNKLDQGRNILLTNRLRDRFDVDTGDEITLRAWGKTVKYRVIGFFESAENGGKYAIISNRRLKLDIGWSDDYYSTIYIKTAKDPEDTLKNLKMRFARQQPYLKTMEDMKVENIRANRQFYIILKGFSLLTMLAGILGILNNLLINFMKRRRNLAIYRSIGMSKKQMVKISFIEALSSGIIGSAAGAAAGVLMILIAGSLSVTLDMGVKISYSVSALLLYMGAGVVITLAASIGPAVRSSKLNPMEAIKYE